MPRQRFFQDFYPSKSLLPFGVLQKETNRLLLKLFGVVITQYTFLLGVTKECFLEALKYLKTSKQHPFETPGMVVCLLSFSE